MGKLLILLSSNYVFLLTLTILTEGLIVSIIYHGSTNGVIKSVFVNLISYPWAYLFYKQLLLNLLVVETAVFLGEIVLFKVLITKNWKQAGYLSFFCNFCSALVGKIISS